MKKGGQASLPSVKETSGEVALRSLRCPQLPVWSVKGHSGGRAVRRGVDARYDQAERRPGSPHSSHSNST